MTSWTPDRIELARKMFIEDGMSAGQIAAAFGDGTSRNAVIGRLHRSGIQRSDAQRRVTAGLSRHNYQRQTKPTVPAKVKAAKPIVEAAKPIVEARIPNLPPRPLEQLGRHECRWAVNGDGGPVDDIMLFCGEPVSLRPSGDRRPWCAAHAKLAYQPQQPRRQSPERHRERINFE